MPRRALSPRLRSVVMQGSLVLVLFAAVGLAALVTRRVRLSMRVELTPEQAFGRLVVRLPARWPTLPLSVERGDAVEVEEPALDAPAASAPEHGRRRLRILRQKSDGLVSPLEHLFRSGRVSPDTLRALRDGRDGYTRQWVAVGGWPGQMITLLTSPRAGVLHKDVIACAVTGSSQALVVHLEGVGPLDASDRELVRQMAENVSIAFQSPAPDKRGEAVEMVDQIALRAPPHFVALPADDPNVLQRQLLLDGHRGAWAAVDLVSCVYFPDDRDDALLAMLHARDPDWRSGPVRRLGPRTLAVDRVDPFAQHFPARAYLSTHPDGRALLAVVRGGLHDTAPLDAAWEAIAASLKFDGSKDLSGLLVNGANAARALADGGLERLLPAQGSGAQGWTIWDQNENADQELWSQLTWQWAPRKENDAGPAVLTATRSTLPIAPYASNTQFEQQWSAWADLSRYQATTWREVRRGPSQFPRQTLEQRVSADGLPGAGRLSILSPAATGAGAASGPSASAPAPGAPPAQAPASAAALPPAADMPLPAQFVPGAVLPLAVHGLAEKPCLLRTESFVDVDLVAGPGLLTVLVTRLADAPLRRDENGNPMDCVSVSINGTGTVSRWYYTHDGTLRFIDFANGIKAQAGR